MHRVSAYLTRVSEALTREQTMPEGASRHDVARVALAMVISYKLTIPSDAVDNPDGYFLDYHAKFAEGILVKTNEYFYVDVEATFRLVEAMWKTRYQMVHQPFSNAALTAQQSALGDTRFRIPGVHRQLMGMINPQFVKNVHDAMCDEMREMLGDNSQESIDEGV